MEEEVFGVNGKYTILRLQAEYVSLIV